eukprot:CAMPEP_0172888610 /NCGR_PEP_ID=MMETSP1075-20121228/136817_1 /TAXON_ID=2916 /ORGANISM="Ceratium fusus, Strain PA161109" /LENGTH=69 /DNA_ID=CAMNT_0013742515 /DNA_START=92 /DNA_END=298 /DNA_ORIENTATION=-
MATREAAAGHWLDIKSNWFPTASGPGQFNVQLDTATATRLGPLYPDRISKRISPLTKKHLRVQHHERAV